MTVRTPKDAIRPFRKAAATYEPASFGAAARALVAEDAVVRLGHPLGEGRGPGALVDAYGALAAAMPDLERRDMILLAGVSPAGEAWVATCGNVFGTFLSPFLGIPPTGHLAHMRYHEFFRFSGGKVVEIQAVWDIPELMMQAGAWPMAPQLGRFLCTPGPMTCDGLVPEGDGAAALALVQAMLEALCRHPSEGGPEVMDLPRFWHPRFNWYGPCGIGTGRGIAGFRHWHQIPFLRAMPDRSLDQGGLVSHWIAEGDYVCETGWPNMRMTISRDGWLGIPPLGREITLRSLDFWRVEGGLIRENWVLIDLLDMYRQIGVDVLGRMAEFNKARPAGSVVLPEALA
ncbi:ester cyclase [Prosthecomicrobium sp. N25]|uniref:ester cyclase n=1 Tax=Prosthecomicrobium sp. N25 TaxID=3129254 RepID=UPI003076CC33